MRHLYCMDMARGAEGSDMPWMILDEWSFWRRDMAERAHAMELCSAWSHGARDDDCGLNYPKMTLDWDGAGADGEGGPIARLIARGRFPDPKDAGLAFSQACRLPVVEAKLGHSRIEIRFSAPVRPGMKHEGWELVGQEKSRDWSKF